MIKLTEETFDQAVCESDIPCLVLFSKNSCGMCEIVHPRLEELSESEEYEGKFNFFEVNVSEDRPIFNRYSLRGVPQVLFFRHGEVLAKMVGEQSYDAYESKVRQYI